MPDRPTVSLPLGFPPRIALCALAEHGLRGEEVYQLPRHWCLHLYFYEVEVEIDGQNHSIVPGAITLIPPGTRIVYRYTRKRHRHFFIHFALQRKAPVVVVPVWQHLPDARDEIFDRLQNIQRVLTRNRAHAEVLFWALLWDVAEAGAAHHDKADAGARIVEAADEFIAARLPEKLTVADLAAHLSLSATHLNRVIKARLGVTTVQLIKRRRLQRVHRLLVHSTMPINLIGAECGLPDLQQLNKLMRREYGKSPRQLRAGRVGSDEPTWAIERE